MSITAIIGIASVALPAALKLAQMVKKHREDNPRPSQPGGPLERFRRWRQRNKVDYDL